MQLTPPGSGCSIALGHGHHATPRPARSRACSWSSPDIEAAHAELVGAGVEVERRSRTSPWGSFVYFNDPDGNGWAVQQVVPRAA